MERRGVDRSAELERSVRRLDGEREVLRDALREANRLAAVLARGVRLVDGARGSAGDGSDPALADVVSDPVFTEALLAADSVEAAESGMGDAERIE